MARTPKGTPPAYQRHSSGQARVRFTLPNGRRTDILLGPYGSPESYAEYERKLAEWRANGCRWLGTGKEARVASDLTIHELCLAFWDYAEKHYTVEGRELKHFALSLAPLRRLYGHTPAREFGPRALKAVQGAMADGSWMSEEEKARARKRGDPIGWCRNVVNRRVTRIKTLFRWAESEELVPPSTFHALQTVRGLPKNTPGLRTTKPVKPATLEEVEAVVGPCPRAVAAMIRLQWLAGMRSCEVRIMRTCDIDQAGPVVDGVQVWLYRPGKHKNEWRESDQQRVVPLGPECQRILAEWLRPDDPEAYLFSPQQTVAERNARRRKNPKDGPRRKTKKNPKRPPGACYTPFSYAQAVRRAAEKAGLPGFHAYRCRHGAKMRIERVAGAEAARAVLGHKSILTTQHYGQLDVERASEVASKLA